MKSSILAFYVLSFFAAPLQAVFFMGERFVNRQGNVIECFGDIHLACNESDKAKQQQDHIIDLAYKQGSLVIAEDMNARYGINDEIAHFEVETKFDSPLDNLSTRCIDTGIKCENVEFREESAASLGGFPIPAYKTLYPFNAIAHEVMRYRDGALLNMYYWRMLSNVFNGNKFLIEELKNVDCSLQDYCQNLNEEKRTRINLFDAAFLDARILHTIYANRLKQHIIVCAGANHIQRIKPMLCKLGYKSLGGTQKEVILCNNDTIHACSALSIQDCFNECSTWYSLNSSVYNQVF